MSTAREIVPGRSRRVEAWIYTVMNPVIDATRREAHLLERDNLSWRYYSRHAEYIRVISEYIDAHNMPNLEDFLADNEPFTDKFKQHDHALRTAEKMATDFVEFVTLFPLFMNEVNEAVQHYELALDVSQPFKASLESIKRDLPKLIAEYLVNNIDSLPNTYMTYKFWEQFSQKFQAHKEREPYLKLQNAVRNLREVSSDLRQDLENQRLQFCRDFDVPAAPPTPPATASDMHLR